LLLTISGCCQPKVLLRQAPLPTAPKALVQGAQNQPLLDEIQRSQDAQLK
jgi:hypothetical protein